MSSKLYTEYVHLAEHYKAIGQTSIFLWDEEDKTSPKPYQYVTKATLWPRDSLKTNYGAATVELVAEHPCGLNFQWTEPIFVNNRLYDRFNPPVVDQKAILRLMINLPTKDGLWESLKEQLKKIAVALHSNRNEKQEYLIALTEAIEDLEWYVGVVEQPAKEVKGDE